ncbi:MAG: hypothetical protein N2578_02515 [Bdellovibrionaceae bacterium]|nr:hypothetical protein [Pseudobdellovibrionaceae bacterium]
MNKVYGLFLSLPLAFTACSSNPHKAQKLDTKIENAEQVTGDTKLGIKDGEMIVQQKVLMNEELRRLQYEVYELEDRVYGTRKLGSKGLYGVLKDCRNQLSDPANGGDGKLKWTEPIDRVTDKEEEFNIGLDEKNKLVGISEEYLKDRIARFKKYKSILQKREDEYEEKVEICRAQLKAQKAKNKTTEVSE